VSPRRRIWTDEQLVEVAPRCRTWLEVAVALGLGPYHVNAQTVQKHAARLGITLTPTRSNPPGEEGRR
jgi:hypothetical protein